METNIDAQEVPTSSRGMSHFVGFLSVGATGLFVNQFLLYAFTEWLGFHYMLSAALATQGSTLWNFVLIETLVFTDSEKSKPAFTRFFWYVVVNNGLLLLRSPMLFVFTEMIGWHYLVGNFASIVILAVLRYAISARWLWPEDGQGTGTEGTRGTKGTATRSPHTRGGSHDVG